MELCGERSLDICGRPNMSAYRSFRGKCLIGLFVLVGTLLAGCNRNSGTQSALPIMSNSSNPSTSSSTATPSAADPNKEVTLSPGQVRVVRVELAKVQQFQNLKELSGSISYRDDPNLIQAELRC